MDDHDDVELPSHSSRRRVLQAGLFALAAAHLPDNVLSRALAQDAKPAPNLIGKLEGAEVVLDPARYPKTFKEAPPLAEGVQLVMGADPQLMEAVGRKALLDARHGSREELSPIERNGDGNARPEGCTCAVRRRDESNLGERRRVEGLQHEQRGNQPLQRRIDRSLVDLEPSL